MGPSFSVCIPNYNYARYLRTALESILAQTYDNYEIVIADNASTDDSVAVAQSFGSDRIRVLENRYNIGFAPNLDRATQTAKNDYLIVISSDDVMHPNALERYAAVLTELGDAAPRAVLTSAIDIIDSEGRVTGVSHRPERSLFYETVAAANFSNLGAWLKRPVERTPGSRVLRETLRAKDSPAVFLATCYSRALYEAVEGYNSGYRMWPDGHFLNKLLSQVDTELVYVPERLFQYRVHDSNQLAGEAKRGSLKYQVDAYLHTLEFPDDVLGRVGVRRDELVDVFVEKSLMERGLQAMATDNRAKALKCLAFGFATYPEEAAREPKTYALAGLLAMGRAGPWMADRLYRWHQVKKARA